MIISSGRYRPASRKRASRPAGGRSIVAIRPRRRTDGRTDGRRRRSWEHEPMRGGRPSGLPVRGNPHLKRAPVWHAGRRTRQISTRDASSKLNGRGGSTAPATTMIGKKMTRGRVQPPNPVELQHGHGKCSQNL